MQVDCFGQDRPWFLLTLGDVRILLDAGWDIHRVSSSHQGWQDMPIDPVKSNMSTDKLATSIADGATTTGLSWPPIPADLDFSRVDIWLLSNYWQAIALPYFTEYHAFHGRIIATEPTIIFARLYMNELVHYFHPDHATQDSNMARLESFRPMYTQQDIERCLNRVQAVRYHELVKLLGNVQVMAYSAGYCLGSANWRVTRDTFSMVYISSSSLVSHLHPSVWEEQILNAPLHVALVADVRHDPALPPQSMLDRFRDQTMSVLRRGGNVLLPIHLHGLCFDLLLLLLAQLEKSNLHIPIMLIGPMVNRARQYSDILGEWMRPKYRDRMYIPENPLIDDTWLKTGRISYHAGFDESFTQHYREPCIVFAGHPSLRAGEATHFVRRWGQNTNNAIVFTDPFLDHHLALAPFGQVQAQIIHCPIDLRFSPETCRTRLLPKSPTNTIHLLPAHVYQHTREQPTTQVKLYQSGDRILLDIPPEPYRQAWLSESLARQLTMHHVGSGCEAAWCDVTLHWRHGELYLEAASPSEHPSSDTQATTDNDAFTSRRFYGRISHNQLLHRMEQLRLGQVSVQRNTETGQMRIRAQLENARILVLLSDWGTEILTESQRAQELMADILRDLMLEI